MVGATLVCLVIAITDGDTLRVRCEVHGEARSLIIRLSQIDAPERWQPWGNRSRQHLAAMCLNKRATVHEEGHDRYRRIVARIQCDGLDANAEQVRAGLAWVFDRYVTDRALYSVQAEAQDLRRGLWADDEPVAPWFWRQSGAKQSRSGSESQSL
jgi:endonuclease YncB( thermonuclease family)